MPLPPVAESRPKSYVVHGDQFEDPYFWFRDKNDPKVIKYLQDENDYTNAVMAPLLGLREKLFLEMRSRIQEDDETVPVRDGLYEYFERTSSGKQYKAYCRRKIGDPAANTQVLLDLNALADTHSFLAVGEFAVSDDGNLLAYTLDTVGFREYRLHVVDLRTGKEAPDDFGYVADVEWAADSRHIYYVREDDAKRSYRVARRCLGDAAEELLYDESDAHFEIDMWSSRSKDLIVIHSESMDTSECRIVDRRDPAAKPSVVLLRTSGHRYYVEQHGSELLIRTNLDAPNFKIVKAPFGNAEPKNWQEVLPHDVAICREDLDAFAQYAVVTERANADTGLRVIDLETGESTVLAFPETPRSVSAGDNRQYESTVFRYSYESYVRPFSTFEYDVLTGEHRLVKQMPVLGGYDPADYQSERLWATAADGTQVPMSIVKRRDTVQCSGTPTLLYGYGAYGISASASFSSNRLSLLDRGVVYAVAHVRGGADLGQQWWNTGKLRHKMNTFTDFIACAKHLIDTGLTSPDHLAAEGGSAGGLLMGAVTNLAPECFRAIILDVPFVDVINTMLDETLPLTIGEYLEWGNPHIEEEYRWLRAYCPYTNLKARPYPAIYVEASLNDSQVMFWEPAKYMAKLRTVRQNDMTTIMRMDMTSGHHGASGRFDKLRDIAYKYSFLLKELRLADDDGRS
jgi:oligopeptidase B